jgi:hypothetical protein
MQGYKVRWTAEGKPKEKFRKNYDDALALKIEIEETILKKPYSGILKKPIERPF